MCSQLERAKAKEASKKEKNDSVGVEINEEEGEEKISTGASKLTVQEFETLLSYLCEVQLVDFHDSEYFAVYM